MSMLSGFSHIQLFVTLWTVARQAPLSMGFSRQEYWCGFPCPPPGNLPDPGIKHLLYLLYWKVGSLLLVPSGKPHICLYLLPWVFLHIFEELYLKQKYTLFYKPNKHSSLKIQLHHPSIPQSKQPIYITHFSSLDQFSIPVIYHSCLPELSSNNSS